MRWKPQLDFTSQAAIDTSAEMVGDCLLSGANRLARCRQLRLILPEGARHFKLSRAGRRRCRIPPQVLAPEPERLNLPDGHI